MSIRERSQRRMFDRQLRRLGRDGDEDARQLVESMTKEMRDDVYQLALDRFVMEGRGQVVARDESQTPILDRLLEFFQWLWESGALLEIIKLIIGGGLMTVDSEVVAFYQSCEE